MTTDGIPMLADFGVSRALIYSNKDLNTSTYGRFKGTPRWMAYELVVKNPNNEVICAEASDMWAYGMVIYVCF